MCLLAYCEKRTPTFGEFGEAFRSNKDGVGFAWYNENGEIQFKKGFMKFWNAYTFLKELKPPFVMHWRIGTSGDKIAELTHPFVVGEGQTAELEGTGKNVLFHNGVIYNYKDMLFHLAMAGHLIKTPYNDTKVFAVLVGHLSKVGYSYKEIIDMTTGKFVIMDKEGVHKFGDFHENNGIWFSNKSYEATVSWYAKKDSKTTVYNGYSNSVYNEEYWRNYNQKVTATNIIPTPATNTKIEQLPSIDGFHNSKVEKDNLIRFDSDLNWNEKTEKWVKEKKSKSTKVQNTSVSDFWDSAWDSKDWDF
jgi:predicted glutamine amidotransferase